MERELPETPGGSSRCPDVPELVVNLLGLLKGGFGKADCKADAAVWICRDGRLPDLMEKPFTEHTM